jgi:hypothetical protein|tara:strand:+ start:14284 stop:14553 length:270 start_codon:yes stop_codon:yes gene_type:complete
MTEFTKEVEEHRVAMEAMEWSNKVACLHGHSLNSMYYDNRPQDTENNQSVTDIEYNNGTIIRELSDGTKIVMVEGVHGKELVSRYTTQK